VKFEVHSLSLLRGESLRNRAMPIRHDLALASGFGTGGRSPR
jgi:hypothetical protein